MEDHVIACDDWWFVRFCAALSHVSSLVLQKPLLDSNFAGVPTRQSKTTLLELISLVILSYFALACGDQLWPYSVLGAESVSSEARERLLLRLHVLLLQAMLPELVCS